MRALQIILLIGALSVCSASDVPAAMFAWGSSDFVVPGPTARRVSYQAESTTLLESLVGGLLGGGTLAPAAAQFFNGAAAKPDVTVLFLGSKVDVADAGKVQHLRAALDAAPASVSLLFVRHEGAGSLQARLAAAAGAALQPATLHRMGACDGTAAAAAPLKGHPLPEISTATGPVVVLVCSTAEDTLEDEAAILAALSDAIAAAGARHLFVYASEGPQAVGGQRTLLAKGTAKSVAAPAPAPGPGHMVCDAKCKTQVNQLEAGILLIVLIVALGMGTYCMGILDAPTRFESVKDENR